MAVYLVGELALLFNSMPTATPSTHTQMECRLNDSMQIGAVDEWLCKSPRAKRRWFGI